MYYIYIYKGGKVSLGTNDQDELRGGGGGCLTDNYIYGLAMDETPSVGLH